MESELRRIEVDRKIGVVDRRALAIWGIVSMREKVLLSA